MMSRHRSIEAQIDPQLRQARLEEALRPLGVAWKDHQLTESLSTFDGFRKLLGMDLVQQYMQKKQAHRIQDWSTAALDDEGRAIQAQMDQMLQVSSVIPYKMPAANNLAVIATANHKNSDSCLDGKVGQDH